MMCFDSDNGDKDHIHQVSLYIQLYPDSKIHGANVGSTWGRQDPGGPHDGHTNLAIWELA